MFGFCPKHKLAVASIIYIIKIHEQIFNILCYAIYGRKNIPLLHRYLIILTQRKSSMMFPVSENFLYQAQRKVSRNLMLNSYQAIKITSIFALKSGTKKRFSHEGTL